MAARISLSSLEQEGAAARIRVENRIETSIFIAYKLNRSCYSIAMRMIAIWLLVAALASAQDNLTSAGALFHKHCAACHGMNANARRAPPLLSARSRHGVPNPHTHRSN